MAAPSEVAPGGAEGQFQGRDDFWRVSAPEMMRSLGTPEVGLSAREAARRLRQAGPNSVRARKKASATLLFLAQFKSPIILMLVFAALVSLYFQSYIDASIVLCIVFLSGLLGFYQEFSASGALEPIRQGVRRHFGSFGRDVASGLKLRHDHGSQYMSRDFQAEVAFLGIESSPAFVRAPEGNGVAERFIRTLKEQLLWVRTFRTVEEVRVALHEWLELYNEQWLVGRHGHRPPAQVRRDLLAISRAAA